AIAAEKTRMRVDDYQIDVELLPQTHKLTARATVKVTALEDLSVATFQLNNALRITKLTDANNKPLTPERNTQDSSVRIALTSGIAKNASTSFYFEYEGTLESADDSPVQGLKLAYVGPDTSYLLYRDHQRDRSRAHGGDRQRKGTGHDCAGKRKSQEASDRSGERQDFHLCLGQAEFSGHDHCRHIPGIQERRRGHRPARVLQTQSPGSGRGVCLNGGQGVHLLRYAVWKRALDAVKGRGTSG